MRTSTITSSPTTAGTRRYHDSTTTPRRRCARARAMSTMPRPGRRLTTSGSISCSTVVAACSSPAREPIRCWPSSRRPTRPPVSRTLAISGGSTTPGITQSRPGLRDPELHRGRDPAEHRLGLKRSRPGPVLEERAQPRWKQRIHVVVTGEHSGLANLLPGNPGIIDPPAFNSATASPHRGHTAGLHLRLRDHRPVLADRRGSPSHHRPRHFRPPARWPSPRTPCVTPPTTRSTARSRAATPGRW